jgi:3-isopropylmalate/(R)-2-methylmalate dehydratase small subunit
MKAIREVTGRAVPLDRSDVDTDQIIPSDFLKRVERTGFGEGLFADWREHSDFVLNRPEYQGDDVRILVAGPNFGTGSSREHAVWALEDYGFGAVISAKFADIFRANSLKVGLVPVELPADVVDRIMAAAEADPTVVVTVDVAERRVVVPAIGIGEPFPLDDFQQDRLLKGLDDIALTLRHDSEIADYEENRPAWLPST